MGFFRELGTKIDNKILDIKDWIRERHLTSFYYKWYVYLFSLSKAKEMGVGQERAMETLDHWLKMGQIYKWQHVRLKEQFEEHYKYEEE